MVPGRSWSVAGSSTRQVLGFQLGDHRSGVASHLCLSESSAEAPLGLGCGAGGGWWYTTPCLPELGLVQANAHGSGSHGQFHAARSGGE